MQNLTNKRPNLQYSRQIPFLSTEETGFLIFTPLRSSITIDHSLSLSHIYICTRKKYRKMATTSYAVHSSASVNLRLSSINSSMALVGILPHSPKTHAPFSLLKIKTSFSSSFHPLSIAINQPRKSLQGAQLQFCRIISTIII